MPTNLPLPSGTVSFPGEPSTELNQRIQEFLKSYDWAGMAKAYREGQDSWNAGNWESFVTHIRQEERTRILGIIEEMIKLNKTMLPSASDWITAEFTFRNQALEAIKEKLV